MNPVTRSRLVSSLVSRLCLVGAVFGSAAMASLAAQAAQIGASATYMLVTAPPALMLSILEPVKFGQLYIPASGELTYQLFPLYTRTITSLDRFGINRFGERGTITIGNAIPGTEYKLMTRALSDGPSSRAPGSCVINGVPSSSVSFNPASTYGAVEIPNGDTFIHRAGVNILHFGGSLKVSSTAPAGQGTCTFEVSVVKVGA